MKIVASILVIVDPTVERDFVIDRAKSILKIIPASVRFFINSSNTLTQHSYAYEGMDGHFFEKQRLLFIEHYSKLLEDLVDEFTDLGINATSAFTEEHHLAESIIAQIKEYQPDLVLKSTHHHHMLRKSLISNTDWRLIRKSPCPLLLVKSREWFDNGSVVASIDPLHNKAAQTKLDHLLIRTAESVASQFKQTARVFHCYFPFVSTMFPTASETSEQVEEIRKRHQQKLDEVLASHSIDPDCVQMSRGDLVPSLIHFLDQSKANILVIGALSRNFLERAIVGNTAEKILDDCPCDVLIIKP
ncbi:MAG: universal stress protein [Gammaproteobacteria bacterium]|nr:universal stress protein [Gammaproteobacteria bacterium]